jgi:GWxTD domain-containing protein
LISSWIPPANAQDAKIHQKGKKHIRARRWDKAIETYDQLVRKYPRSLYTDDAQFWIGFSWEQTRGQEKQAFASYQRVIDNYPGSPWVDDAVVHQISLARKLLQQGDEDYRAFLKNNLDNENHTIRTQAALALGEVRDPAVLPLLETIAKSEDGESARRALDLLQGYADVLEESLNVENEPFQTPEFDETDDVANHKDIYKKLLKAAEGYTEKQLLMNGLYHIVDEKELEFYLSLENEWDKNEWWRKFWKSRDPTPTTPENEAEDEYRHRAVYAYKNFGRDWDRGTFWYPPWDSRGEVYIKYGKPDRRERADDPQWEQWTYYQHRTVFLVSDHLSNRHGKGVYLSPVTRYLLKRTAFHKPQFYYFNPEFATVKKIDDFDLRITSTNPTGSMYRLRFTYQFPSGNLRYKKEDGKLEGGYRYKWIVFDEDFRPLSSSDSIEELRFDENENFKESKVFGNFHTSLVPGSYILAVRIEDIRSNAMGIYRKKFTIRGKGGLQEPQQLP